MGEDRQARGDELFMASGRGLRVAIVGAGLGGPIAGKLLQAAGYDVQLYEQTPVFARLGAGIHLGPNAMRVLDHVGVGKYVAEHGVQPAAWISRKWDTGEILFKLPLGQASVEAYGAPYVTVHRGDLHRALIETLDRQITHYGKRLVDLRASDAAVQLMFADGTDVIADLVIGADGLNSRVREILLGAERPIFTGFAGHRATVPIDRLRGMEIPDLTKWWAADDRYTLAYFLTKARDELYIVTGIPQPGWDSDSSWVESSADEMRDALSTSNDGLRQLVAQVDGPVTKWGFFTRDPLPFWSRGRIVLIGDACHPMKPTMAQGAAMAMEDAAMLARCLIDADDIFVAIRLYEANRRERTFKVQTISGQMSWLRDPIDPSWAFSYDVFSAPLTALAA
jgi:6-hydroxynicotinate 3-monooxygenase